MSKPEKITIAVVTYHGDFLLLERFLQSVYAYWKPEQIDNICIVLNDRSIYIKEFKKLIKKNSDPRFNITTIQPYELEPRSEYFDWHSQQLFKCLIADVINTDWYIIHDCKDYYTQPVDISDAFDDSGRAIMHMNHIRYSSNDKVPVVPGCAWSPGPFSVALKVSFEIFGLDYNDHKTYHFPTNTPFIVKTDIMKSMVAEMKGMLKGMFPFVFSATLDGQCLVTEFLLYGSYCYSKTKNKDYVDWDVNHRKFYIGIQQSKDLRIIDKIPNTSNCDV